MPHVHYCLIVHEGLEVLTIARPAKTLGGLSVSRIGDICNITCCTVPADTKPLALGPTTDS
jgi:hypothetical protein